MSFSLEYFLKSGHRIDYKKNDYILKEGQISQRVYFVIEGIVRHYLVDYSGNEKTIRISKENNLFYSSNVSFYNSEPSHINCQVLADCKLLYWTKEELDNLSKKIPEFVVFENEKLKDFIIEKHQREISLMSNNAKERLIEFNSHSINLFNRIPHHVIASYLDMTPETLSRLRAKIKEQKS